MDTASAIGNVQTPPVFPVSNEAFIDINQGDWEGVTRSDVKAVFPDLYARWMESPEEVRFPNGENLQEAFDRLWNAFRGVLENVEDGDAVIVSHHIALRLVFCGILGLRLGQYRQFEIAPASVSEVRVDHGGLVIHRLNDTGHLGCL